jgi:hypothetical protein
LWVFIAFLASCALMVVMSWIVAFFPDLTLKAKDVASHGIFVKNYIDQSQEFALCAVALAYPIVMLVRAKRVALACLLCVLALAFVTNMAFVIVSRTALVTMPIMLAVFGLLHLRLRTAMGCDRGRAALYDVAVAPDAVSRGGADQLDRAAGGGAEHLHLAVQLPHLRFPRRLDVCAGHGRCRRHGVEGAGCETNGHSRCFLNALPALSSAGRIGYQQHGALPQSLLISARHRSSNDASDATLFAQLLDRPA